jgi:hypothetical protein
MDNKTERVPPPISYARKNADGFWCVAVTWGNGRKEQLGPFKTEAVAQEHIKAQLAAWHEGQKVISETAAITTPPLTGHLDRVEHITVAPASRRGQAAGGAHR